MQSCKHSYELFSQHLNTMMNICGHIHIGRNQGGSISMKNTSTCKIDELGNEWLSFWLVEDSLFVSRCHPNLRIQNKQTLLFHDRVVIRKWCTKILSIHPSIYQGWALGVGVHLWGDSQETEMLIQLTLTLLPPLWDYLCCRIIIICMCILCGNTGSRSKYRSKWSCSWSSQHTVFFTNHLGQCRRFRL